MVAEPLRKIVPYSVAIFVFPKQVVKLMAADVLDIALVRQAFPEVPWIFMTRDPAEILALQAASAGIDLMRGQIPAARLGLTEDALWTMPSKAYQAHVLAAFSQAAADACPGGRGLILDHSEVPTALWTRVLPHFGLAPSTGAVEVMQAVSQRHSKRPGEPFSPERDKNRIDAAAFRSIAEPARAMVATLRNMRARDTSLHVLRRADSRLAP